jgi:hypothetical protein
MWKVLGSLRFAHSSEWLEDELHEDVGLESELCLFSWTDSRGVIDNVELGYNVAPRSSDSDDKDFG